MNPIYTAATTNAVWFDRSSTAKLLLIGPDAPQFLHNISTNDVNGLPLGGGCELFFCDARARVLFLARVYHILHAGDHALWLETTAGRDQALFQHLDRFLIAEAVELQNVTSDYLQWHLAGPKASAIIATITGTATPELAEHQHMERQIASATVSIRRRSPLGMVGYDLVFLPTDAEIIRSALLRAGAMAGDEATYETLRVEAGTPEFGPDIDETRFVMEVGGASQAVSYTKGCFPGQEPIVMARDRAGRVNRSFLGLNILEGTVEAGSPLLVDGQEVGKITSTTVSPRFGGPFALGYVHWKHVAPGTVLQSGVARLSVRGWPPR
jgi:folate-binding protein YgfZ